MTYAVVGCSECQSLWLLEDDNSQAAHCPTCGTRHQRDALRPLAQAEDRDVASQQRTALLADRAGAADADLDPYWAQDARAAEVVVDDRTYLNGLGVAPELVDQLTDEPEESEPDESEPAAPSTTTTQSPGSGPDVDVPVAERPQLHGTGDEPHTPGISVIDPGGQLGIAGHTYQGVSPRTSEWLADVIAELVPSTARLVQDIARERYDFDYRDPDAGSGAVETVIHDELVTDIAQLESVDANTAAVEEARSYLDAIGRYALLWADDVYRVRRGFKGTKQFDRITSTLETVGTSRGQFNAGVDALRHSLVALHAERAVPRTLTFLLDGEAWTAADRDTIKRALTAFDALADGFDVRLWMSPGVRQRVRRLTNTALDTAAETRPTWADRFAFLTDGEQTSRRSHDGTAASADPEVAAEAWGFVEDNANETGLLTVLAHLDAADERSVRALKRDVEIDYADTSIDRYVADLEPAGLIDIDRTHASNRLSLTPLGTAAQEYVTSTGEVVHRNQSQLVGASYGHPSASHKYSVAPQQTGGTHHPPAEQWLAETGDPAEDGYVQFLGDSAGPREVEPPVLHRRILAGERAKGVNFADSDIIDWTEENQAPNGDGRVSYVSIFDDHALCVTQWGGPAQMLARLCASLLSNKMLSKALNIDAVGAQFEQTHGGVDAFENDLHDVLTRAQQIGWLSEDELEHYDAFRERYGSVRSTLLSTVAGLGDLTQGERSELFEDLHGLLCSATHLYRAAGIDVTFNIRLPRTKELLANGKALEDFLDFMRYTVTKQAGYEDENGFHSWFRMCVEDRKQKLKARAAYDVDDGDSTAELTASWIVSGPEASELRDLVEDAVDEESSRLRERVAEGTEQAATLDIPVVEANSYAHIRGLVREMADRKGFHEANRQDLDRLARCLEATLATDDRGPDPYLVADALSSLEARDRVYDSLDVHAIETALAELPSTAIFPTLPPAARRMLSALFASDEPLDRQALIDITSESSYDRHWKTLRAFFLVERTDDGFVAHLEPWWASTNDEREPFHEDHPMPLPQREGVAIKRSAPPTDPGRLIMEVIVETDHIELSPERYTELGYRQHEWHTLLEELDLERFRPILQAFCDDWHEADSESYSNPSGVQIGPQSAGPGVGQVSIAEAMAGAD
ncbi:DUF5817 domain-containing protein [Halomicrobium katesii]|uniref:DUF5817 domain-containing protein n=1 Tax=Halomicrobium katesii TaxID=437163 RepID=UPI00037CCA6A|nr:DUF5817 domain-containing protein [Halomicrobium katesii]